MENTIRKHVIENAIKFKGKANPGAIIGKILAEYPEYKSKPKELMEIIKPIVDEVNDLSIEEQQSQLEKLGGSTEKEKKKRGMFDFLNTQGKINTAFPPGPEKYPHVGHAKSCLLNYMLAKEKDGKFVLRFEDTNPNLVKPEFYEIMQENFRWLGIEWDELVYASDYMELFYEKALELIEKGKAYVDKSSGEDIKKSRETGEPTPYRELSIEENLNLWEEMKTLDEGIAIVRLKIDLKHKNSVLRDPTIFRVIKTPHARQGDKYNIWPNYDFQNAIMDSINNVDMRLRSKEFEMRGELQRWIQKELGIKETGTYEFGRFNMTGVLSSGRVIREKIDKGELIGWDDPSLTTIVALRRRGFLPEAIKNFVVSTGLSKADATVTWDDMVMHNKRLLDNKAERYSAIFDTMEITVENCPEKEVELSLNPNQKEGGRNFKVDGNFIISKEDYESIEEDELVRMMDCVNVIKKDGKLVYHSEGYMDFKGKGNRIINWLPIDGNFEISVMMPDKTFRTGFAEHTISKIEVGQVVQFERFAFCRLDKIENNAYHFWYTH